MVDLRKLLPLALFLASAGRGTAHATEAAPCENFANAPMVQEIVSALRQVKALPPIFAGYRISDFTIVLTDSSAENNCAALLEDAEIQTTAGFDAPLLGPAETYSIYVDPETALTPDMQLVRSLRAIKAAFADAISGPALIYDLKSSSWERSYKGAIPLAAFHFGVLVHEGFHFAIQSGSLRQESSASIHWPAWARASLDRESLAKECYAGNEVAFGLRSEILVLSESLHSDDADILREASFRFLSMQRERFDRTEQGMVDQMMAQESLSCRAAESMMQMVEGMASYVEYATGLQLGLIGPDELHLTLIDLFDDQSRSGQVALEPHYQLGALQLHLMSRLSPEEFPEILERLVNSKRFDEAISSELSRLLRKFELSQNL